MRKDLLKMFVLAAVFMFGSMNLFAESADTVKVATTAELKAIEIADQWTPDTVLFTGTLKVQSVIENNLVCYDNEGFVYVRNFNGWTDVTPVVGDELALDSVVLLYNFAAEISATIEFPDANSVKGVRVVSTGNARQSATVATIADLTNPDNYANYNFDYVRLEGVSVRSGRQTLIVLGTDMIPLSDGVRGIVYPEVANISGYTYRSAYGLQFMVVDTLDVEAVEPSVKEVANTAELKKIVTTESDSVRFTGELTVQVVKEANQYVAFDSEGFVLVQYDVYEDFDTLAVGDVIAIDTVVVLQNNDNTVATLLLNKDMTEKVRRVSTGADLREPVDAAIADIKDVDAANLQYVRLTNVSLYAIDLGYDFENYLVSGVDTIKVERADDNLTFPSRMNVAGFTWRTFDGVSFYVMSGDDVEALEINNLAALRGSGAVNGLNVAATKVLVTSKTPFANGNIYRMQGGENEYQPFGVQFVDTTNAINVAVGDSIALSGVINYTPFSFTEVDGLFDIAVPAMISIAENATLEATVLNSGNEPISFEYSLGSPEFQFGQNAVIVTSTPGEFFATSELDAKGYVGYAVKFWDESFDTILVENKYYVEAGSPTTGMISGHLFAEYNAQGEYYYSVVPRSAADFISDVVEFATIAEMIEAGTPDVFTIKYRYTGAATITAAILTPDATQYIFIEDETAALYIVNSDAQNFNFTTGQSVTGICGSFYGVEPANEEYGWPASPAYMEMSDVTTITEVTPALKISPEDVTIAQLIDGSVDYASSLVRLENVTVKEFEAEDDENGGPGPRAARFGDYDYYFYQGEDSIFAESMTIINYPLDEALENIIGVVFQNPNSDPQIIIRSQEDLNKEEEVAVEVVEADANVYVAEGIVVAEGAQIYLVDVAGRLIATGVNSIDMNNLPKQVYVAITMYGDGKNYVTKVVR